MHFVKRILAILAIFLTLPVFVSSAQNVPVKMGLLVTSDLQSHIFPFETTIRNNGKKKTIQVGGLGRISALAEKLRQETDGTLVLSTGDDLMVPFYEMFKGIPEIKAMNMAGYDAITPGNHEFDLGVRTYVNAAKEASFDIISSNLSITDSGLSQVIKPYTTKSVAGLKIGIFGLMTPDLARVSNVGNSVTVKDPFSTALEMVKTLKAQKVDMVICLTHIGTQMDMQLARTVPGIDIIVGGHTHDYLFRKIRHNNGKEVLIVHAGVGGEKAGVLKFAFDSRITKPTWKTVLLDEKIASDQNIDSFLKPYKIAFEKKLSEPVGASEVDLDARKTVIRQKESNLGNLIVDSWIDWFKSKNNAVDCAVMNGGGIRGDRIYPAGNISLKTLLEIHPFGNTVYKLTLTGEQLLRALEISASTMVIPEDGCDTAYRPHGGAFLQVGGIRFVIDPNKKPFCAIYEGRKIKRILCCGERVIKAEILRNGTWVPVEKKKTYVVLTNSWLACGGDGYYVFNEAKKKEDTTFRIVDLLTFYLKKHSPVKPATEGRITILSPVLAE